MSYAPQHLVLAIYPFTRGLAFVFFEGPGSPYLWGIKRTNKKRKSTKAVDEVRKLIEQHRPAALVIEDTTDGMSHRAARVRKLYRMLAHLAQSESVELQRITKHELRDCFALAGATTKYEIAKAIAVQMPNFVPRMPPIRKPWMSSDPRQSLFDAIALAIAFYRRLPTEAERWK